MTNKPSGLRTHIFVCMGACLFIISSFYLLPSESIGVIDATRILQVLLPASVSLKLEVLLQGKVMFRD